MTEEEISQATETIRAKLPEFDYAEAYQKTQDTDAMLDIYRNSGSNYEKLQIYRIIFCENSGNAVVKKFVNETFHIENDFLFQLNPRKYDTVPRYIIEECDKDIAIYEDALVQAGGRLDVTIHTGEAIGSGPFGLHQDDVSDDHAWL